jgi:hypothetical protein
MLFAKLSAALVLMLLSIPAFAADSALTSHKSEKIEGYASELQLNTLACFRFDGDPLRCAARLDCVWIPITRRCLQR